MAPILNRNFLPPTPLHPPHHQPLNPPRDLPLDSAHDSANHPPYHTLNQPAMLSLDSLDLGSPHCQASLMHRHHHDHSEYLYPRGRSLLVWLSHHTQKQFVLKFVVVPVR